MPELIADDLWLGWRLDRARPLAMLLDSHNSHHQRHIHPHRAAAAGPAAEDNDDMSRKTNDADIRDRSTFTSRSHRCYLLCRIPINNGLSFSRSGG